MAHNRGFRYPADLPSSLETAQYDLPPWSRVEIVIGGFGAAGAPDRSLGVILPEIQGKGLLVERSDWPVLLSPVRSAAPLAEQAVIARDGLMFDSPFAGLWLAHPPLFSAFNTYQYKLSLIVFNTSRSVDNGLAEPITRAQVSARQIVDDPLSQVIGLFVPPGARMLKSLHIGYNSTTVTLAPKLLLLDKQRNTITPPVLDQQLGAAIATYNLIPAQARIAENHATATATRQADFGDIPIPTACREIEIEWSGTGLTPPVSIEGIWM